MSEKEPRVISFSKIKKESVFTNESKESMETLKENAKVNSKMEIDKFRLLINNAISEISDMALFSDTAPMLEAMFIVGIADVVEDIIKGKKPIQLDDSTYKSARIKMFKSLIKKYDNQER